MTDPLPALVEALRDRYRIERELGQGGMATVYLAQDLRHDRQVAIKVLRPELAAVIGADRFLSEIKTTANLQHPHILPLHDSGEAGSFLFYVMPFVEGESLRDRLTRDTQLPIPDAVRVATEIGGALDYAHRHGVIHRDIKPENILLHDGRAVVADFGIALAASKAGGSRMTETGMSLGTPTYMSPEQAMGERELDARSDVYALGCVLYEMLCGEPPFTGPTAQSIVAKVMTAEPERVTTYRKTVPPHVDAAVHTALQKLPADRFASAAEFVAALTRTDFVAATGFLASARPGALTPRGRAVAVAPWIVALLAVAAAVAGWLRAGPPAEVRRQLVVLWESPVPMGLNGLSVAIAPQGGLIVYVDTVGGQQQLWAKERDQARGSALAGTAGAAVPVFSPDGNWIAFIADGKVKKIPRSGGAAMTLADSAATSSQLQALAWLDDGTVLFNDQGYMLRGVSDAGGTQRRFGFAAAVVRGVVALSGLPGGRAALVTTCSTGCVESELRVLDLQSDTTVVLTDNVVKGWSLPGGRIAFLRRDGGVFVAPFDAKTSAFRSAPTPVLEGVRADGTGVFLQIGADGTLLYASGGGAAGQAMEVAWVSRAGTVTPVDTTWPFRATTINRLALSPDGRRLAVAMRSGSEEDIWIKELDHGGLTRLTFGGTNRSPAWTVDGRSLVFVAGTTDLAVVLRRHADGTGGEDTLLQLPRPIIDVVPLADTTQLLLRASTPPSRDILLWRRGGENAIASVLANPGYDELSPALSPDGRWLAYTSNELGREEVYVRPYPDINAGRWQVSRAGGSEPAWAPDGRELFYRDSVGLISAAVVPGVSFAVGEQRMLFREDLLWRESFGRTYTVSPDGQRFLFLSMRALASADSVVRLTLVENWLAELEAPRSRRP